MNPVSCGSTKSLSLSLFHSQVSAADGGAQTLFSSLQPTGKNRPEEIRTLWKDKGGAENKGRNHTRQMVLTAPIKKKEITNYFEFKC